MLHDIHDDKREKKENCETCRFFFSTPKGGHGECRAFPPLASIGMHNAFPTVTPDAWCGSFKLDDLKTAELKTIAEFEKKDCCHRKSADENHAPGCKSQKKESQEE